MTLFETAAKERYRYPTTSGGVITTEDLYTLQLITGRINLDEVAQTIAKEIAASSEKSFVKTNIKNIHLDNKLEIVKHVIAYKLAGIEAAKLNAGNKARKSLLIDVLDQKEIDTLKEMSPKELRKEIKKVS